MKKDHLYAVLKYCELKFGTTKISAKEAVAYVEEDARDAGLTVIQYLDYIVANGRLPNY